MLDLNLSRKSLVASVSLLIVLPLVVSVGSVAAQDSSPAFEIHVTADGSAEIVLRLTRDFADDDELTAFRTLENDKTARQEFRSRFRDRLEQTARTASNRTGRDMTITAVELDLARTADNTTGVITLTASWSNLAAVKNGRLVVTEPFASNFKSPRPVEVHAPDGYVVASATPTPSEQSDSTVVWPAGTNFDGFRVVLAPASTTAIETETTGTQQKATDGSGSRGLPGFTMTTGVLAMLLISVVAIRQARK